MGKKRLEIGDKAEAMAKMVELAAEATALATTMAQRDEAIAATNERFADRVEAGSKLVVALKAELKEWAKANRDQAEKDSKTIRFEGVGEIQIRTGNPEVKLQRGVEESVAIRILFDAGMGAFVRTAQELDREGIIAARETDCMERIEAAGIRVTQSESVLFSIEGVGKV
jgi:phage host-nuclease inhibitor protein Gam